MEFKNYLKLLASNDGSDLYLSTNAPPCAKFNGELKMLAKEPLVSGQVQAMAYEVMNNEQIQEFEQCLEMNLALTLPQVGRFRVNIFRQRNDVSMVVRNIKTDIPAPKYTAVSPWSYAAVIALVFSLGFYFYYNINKSEPAVETPIITKVAPARNHTNFKIPVFELSIKLTMVWF